MLFCSASPCDQRPESILTTLRLPSHAHLLAAWGFQDTVGIDVQQLDAIQTRMLSLYATPVNTPSAAASSGSQDAQMRESIANFCHNQVSYSRCTKVAGICTCSCRAAFHSLEAHLTVQGVMRESVLQRCRPSPSIVPCRAWLGGSWSNLLRT